MKTIITICALLFISSCADNKDPIIEHKEVVREVRSIKEEACLIKTDR